MTNAFPTWTLETYPTALDTYSKEVRDFAIQLANGFVQQGLGHTQSLLLAIAQAKEWARVEGKPVRRTRKPPNYI